MKDTKDLIIEKQDKFIQFCKVLMHDFVPFKIIRKGDILEDDIKKAKKQLDKDNAFSGQPEHTEPPLELRICTRCGKEFKSNVDCPICPSCYL